MTKISKNYLSSSCSVEKSAEFEPPVRLYGQAKIRKNVIIGKFSFVNTRTTLHTGTRVGRYCSIGKNIEIGPFDHPMTRLSTSPVSYNASLHFPNQKNDFVNVRLERAKGVTIGNDVWIGSNSVIMRGITVGDGAVIGAGSIVTKDVAPFSIVVGAPAREKRKRFDEATIKRLLKTKWWDQPHDVVSSLDFTDIDACLAHLESIDVKKHSLQETPPIDALGNTEKDQLIRSLQEQIAKIQSGEKKPIPAEKQKFADLLEQMFQSTNAPSALCDFIQTNASQLYSGYKIEDPYDQVILKNKVIHISGLVQDLDTGSDLPQDIQKTILSILSTKQ